MIVVVAEVNSGVVYFPNAVSFERVYWNICQGGFKASCISGASQERDLGALKGKSMPILSKRNIGTLFGISESCLVLCRGLQLT